MQSGATIFVIFESAGYPAWLFAPDTYVEGEFITGDGLNPPEGQGLLLPRRGFGKLWANSPNIRQRLGWATAPETGYVASVQADSITGIRYLSGPNGEIFALSDDQTGWQYIQ